jgi:hypothetical protein
MSGSRREVQKQRQKFSNIDPASEPLLLGRRWQLPDLMKEHKAIRYSPMLYQLAVLKSAYIDHRCPGTPPAIIRSDELKLGSRD